MGIDPAGQAVVGAELSSDRATAALVSGYLEDDHLITRISGVERVWTIEDSRMMMTIRSPTPGGGAMKLRTFELIKE